MRSLKELSIILRPATLADIPVLNAWDDEPHVRSATHDVDPVESESDQYWPHELSLQSDVYRYLIAEVAGRPVGGMLIIDPHREPSHYWGSIEPNLRALDIWIGAKHDLGKGYGETMMRLAFLHCFAEPDVTAVVIDPLKSNARAIAFYQRLGFEPLELRTFGEDLCWVHRLTRAQWRKRFPDDI